MPPPVFDADRARAHPGFGLYFRRYAPFDTFGFGFEGDKRSGPSTSLKVTTRTYGCVMFNKIEVFYWFAGSSGTHYHSTVWGEIVGMSDVRMEMVVRAPDGTVMKPGAATKSLTRNFTIWALALSRSGV